MITVSKEDYLKAIYHLSSQGGFAATSDIAALLEVAPPSVSGIVHRGPPHAFCVHTHVEFLEHLPVMMAATATTAPFRRRLRRIAR